MSVITRGHMDVRDITLKLVDGSIVRGKINLIQRGEQEHRVSDIFVARKEPFVVIFQASVNNSGKEQVLVINKRHVVYVLPEEEL